MLKHTHYTIFLKTNIHHIISTIIILILGLQFIGDQTAIKILGDEFGYWTAAAWLSGKDWSEVAALNSYYGYGYGILLSFILRLPLSPLIEYKIAIVFNILMLNAIYFIIYYLINDQHLFDKKSISSLIALTATLYTGNLFHAQFTMSETIVMFLFWLFILLLYSLNKKYAFYKILLGSLLVLCLYITHHRMLGVMCAGILCLLYLQLKNKRYANTIIFLIITTGLLLGSEYIKVYYQDTYLTSEYTNLLFYNDYSGQVSSVKYAFSWDGFYLFVVGIIGKVFYILSSTYLLAGIAVYGILKKLYKSFKEKLFPSNVILELFVILSVVASIGIATIYLLIYKDRFDFLIYGRYNEFFISVLIVIGLISVLKNRTINIKEIIYILTAYFFIAILVYMELPFENVRDCTFINSAGIYDSLSQYSRSILMVSLKAIAIYFLLYSIKYIVKKEKLYIILVCVLVSVCWTSTYIYDYQFGILSWASITDSRDLSLANYIQKADCQSNIYYYATEGRNVDHLQFLIEDIPIKCIYTDQQLKSIPQNSYLLTEESTELLETDILSNYIYILQSERLMLWKKTN